MVTHLVHQQVFPQEIKSLQRGDNLPSSNPLILLDPILNQGLLHVGRRLTKSTLSHALHPVILPKDSHTAKFFVTTKDQSVIRAAVKP